MSLLLDSYRPANGAGRAGQKNCAKVCKANETMQAHCQPGRLENKKTGRKPVLVGTKRIYLGGQYKVRTCDPCRVKAVLYR
jgi:hypothetical protein